MRRGGGHEDQAVDGGMVEEAKVRWSPLVPAGLQSTSFYTDHFIESMELVAVAPGPGPGPGPGPASGPALLAVPGPMGVTSHSTGPSQSEHDRPMGSGPSQAAATATADLIGHPGDPH